MTHTFQTSVLTSSRRSKGYSFSFSVEVENYEGETFYYDVEAGSFEEASAKVESMCAEDMVDIYNMNIYKY